MRKKKPEKVLVALTYCYNHESPDDCVGCPYRSSTSCIYDLNNDVITAFTEMLKQLRSMELVVAQADTNDRRKNKGSNVQPCAAAVLDGQISML